MKKSELIIITAVGIVIFIFCLFAISLTRTPGEFAEYQYEITAEATDYEMVRLLITNKSQGFVVTFSTENAKVYATTENGEMILIEMDWPHSIFMIGDTAEGAYTYGRDPMGEKIEVRVFLDSTILIESREVTIF